MDSLKSEINKIFSVRVLLFAAAVLIFNLAVSYGPLLPTEYGLLAPAVALAGIIVGFRTYARVRTDWGVLIAIAVAGYLTNLLGDPFVAFASAMSLLIYEIVDWLAKKVAKDTPFYKRVLWTVAIASPSTSTLFLYIINNLTLASLVSMVVSQFVGAFTLMMVHVCRNAAECDDEEFEYMTRL